MCVWYVCALCGGHVCPIHIYKLGGSIRLVPAFVVLAKLGFVFPDSMRKVVECFLCDESKRGAGLQDEGHLSFL